MLYYHHKYSNALKTQIGISFYLKIKKDLFVWVDIPHFLPFHEKTLHNSQIMMLLQAREQKLLIKRSVLAVVANVKILSYM